MPQNKRRLDMLLVERGLFSTRAKAQAAILAGKVTVPGIQQLKAGMEVPGDILVSIAADACPYVSRGGLKLAAALEKFSVSVKGRVALDVGSSTGGFTDCLLQKGASQVYALDVGTGQLEFKLRNDPRVVVMERTHIRDLRPDRLDPKPDLAVVDVSFISLTKALPHVVSCLASGHNEGAGSFDLIALIKPQFELEPKKTPKGIVHKAEYHDEAKNRVRACAQELGLKERGMMESPIRGAKGNTEFLIHWTK